MDYFLCFKNLIFNLFNSRMLVIYLIILSTTFYLAWIIQLIKYITSRSKGSSLLSFKFIVWQMVNLGLLVLIFVPIFLKQPQVIHPNTPLLLQTDPSLKNPLVIEFDRPVDKNIQASIAPEVKGTWEYKSKKFTAFFSDQLLFYPDEPLVPETEYLVELENILPAWFSILRTSRNYLFLIKTGAPPEIENTNPLDGATDIKAHQPIEIRFNKASAKNIDWSYEINPGAEFTLVYDQNRLTAWLEPKTQLNQGVLYHLKLYRSITTADSSPKTELSKEIFFKTIESAAISTLSPQGTGALPHQPLTISFKQPMDKSSVEAQVKIVPGVRGKFSWTDAKTVDFIPAAGFEPDQTYQVTIGADARNLQGGKMEEVFTHTFSTVGHLKVIKTSPENSAKAVPLDSKISITFDQPVSPLGLKEKISLSPALDFALNITAEKVTITPFQSLQFATAYQVIIKPDIQSVHGYASDKAYTFSFTSVPQTFSLAIPLYKQHYNFTCFSVAAQMVLAYRGIEGIEELSFMDEIGYDSTPRNYFSNTWGNPNQGIVGTYDGSGGGYGAHWNPVARAIGKYRKTEVKRNWNLKELLDTVQSGNPVIVWWVNGVWPAKDISWNLVSGEKVYTVNGMHVEVVRGWVGNRSNPQYILTSDSWRGYRKYTPEQFANLWKWFTQTAIIVY